MDKCEVCEGQGFLICGNCDAYNIYETQLAHQTALLREALEVVEEKANDYYSSSTPGSEEFYCSDCHCRKEKGHCKLGCGVAMAQALAPKIKAALGDEPRVPDTGVVWEEE